MTDGNQAPAGLCQREHKEDLDLDRRVIFKLSRRNCVLQCAVNLNGSKLPERSGTYKVIF
jgi:hypothetical protein